jgi:hypothetical protein
MKPIQALAALLLILLVPSVTLAETDLEQLWALGVGIGASVPASPDGFTDNFNTNTSFYVFSTREIGSGFGVRVELGHDENHCEADVCKELVTPKVQFSRISAGLQWQGGNERWRGNLQASLGAYFQDVEISLPLNEFQLLQIARGSDERFGYALGGGVHYFLNERVGLGFDLKAHAVTQEDFDTIWYWTPTGQFIWRF